MSIRLGATLTGAALALGLLGAAPHTAEAVTVNQTYAVPKSKKLVVRGHGFGHGHGMSQYGAYGAAREGRTHREILEFYYPGTAWGTVRGKVRVLITADTGSDVVVSPAAGLVVRDRGAKVTHALPDIAGVTRWRLAVEAGKAVVEYHTDRWRRWKPGGADALVGDGEFRAAEPITLWTPTGSRTYRGRLWAASPTAGSTDRDTVNIVSMDTYVRGVIPAEMPASWPAEAVRAQAVAARTYATWSRAQAPTRYYQICDTTACQVYGGLTAEHPLANDAVDATRKQILTWEGEPAFTQFSASSGGWTAKGSAPFLVAQPDPWDDHSANGVHDWRVTVDARRLEQRYPAIGQLRRIKVVSREGTGEWRGRVWTMVLDGSKADRQMTGNDFRWMFGLRSTYFTFGG